jgi:hypothetical protein
MPPGKSHESQFRRSEISWTEARMQCTSCAGPPVCQINSVWRASLPRVLLNPIFPKIRVGSPQEVPSF